MFNVTVFATLDGKQFGQLTKHSSLHRSLYVIFINHIDQTHTHIHTQNKIKMQLQLKNKIKLTIQGPVSLTLRLVSMNGNGWPPGKSSYMSCKNKNSRSITDQLQLQYSLLHCFPSDLWAQHKHVMILLTAYRTVKLTY